MAEMYLREIYEQSRYFTTEWQLKMLSQACNWHIDIWPVNFTRAKQPYICNLLVILCQDFRGNVIRTSNQLLEIFVFFKNLGCTKINYLDLNITNCKIGRSILFTHFLRVECHFYKRS